MKTKKRILAFLLTLTLTITSLPMHLFAQETTDTSLSMSAIVDSQTTTPAVIEINPNKYIGDGYEVEFKISSQWPGAFNGELILTNTGDEALENWTLKYDFDHDITNMWNAQIVSHEGNSYIIKNMGWNQDIAPGGSVHIGFGANWNDRIKAPGNYDLLIAKQEVEDTDYTIDFKVTSDWGQAFNGEISITNNTEETIEDWALEFDFDRNIERFWTADILEHENNHYVVKNRGYNANITPGATIILGFTGSPGNVTNGPDKFKLTSFKEMELIDIIPVLETVPSHGTCALVDTPIEIKFDDTLNEFKQILPYLQNGQYDLKLNGAVVDSYFNEQAKTICTTNIDLVAYQVYEVSLQIDCINKPTFSFNFKTVNDENEEMNVIVDDFGNCYKILGAIDDVYKVSVSEYTAYQAEEIFDFSEVYPVSSPAGINFDVTGKINRVRIMTEFNELPNWIFQVDEENEELIAILFSDDKQTGEVSFSLEGPMALFPVKEQTDTLVRMMARATTPTPKVTQNFIVNKNTSGHLSVNLTNLCDSRYKYIAEIKKGSTKITTVNIVNNTLDYTFSYPNNESGIYTVRILKKPNTIGFDKEVWKQDIYMQWTPSQKSRSQIEEIAIKYQPILVLAEKERYYPMDLDDMFTSIGNLDRSVKLSSTTGSQTIQYNQLKEYMAYNGYSEATIDLSSGTIATDLIDITGTKASSTIYYSYMEDSSYFYINYHFFYGYDSKDGTRNDPALGSHNFDRESITLQFTKGASVPSFVITAGHVDGQPMASIENGDKTSQKYNQWSNERVKVAYSKIKAPYFNNPVIAVARGSHALYPLSGWYFVDGLKLNWKIGQLAEPAGIVTPLSVQLGILSLGDNKMLFPNSDDFSYQSKYTLKSLELGEMDESNPLNFSGYWVDALGPSNGKFTPFLARENNVSTWCSAATSFDMGNIPSITQTATADINAYLLQLYKVKPITMVLEGQKVRMTWENQIQNMKYIIRREQLQGPGFVEDAVFEINNMGATSYIDTTARPGETYRYIIRGIQDIREGFKVYSMPSTLGTITVSRNTGNAKGTVRSAATLLGISGAIVTVDGKASYTTGAEGSFTIPLEPNVSHTITISKTGYETVYYYNVMVQTGEETYLDTILQLPTEFKDRTGVVKGQVVSALTGRGMKGLNIKIRQGMNNQSGTVIATATTGDNGTFTTPTLKNGIYTGEIGGDDVVKTYFNFICIGEVKDRGIVSVTPKLDGEQMRIVLTWGANPRDLDSHLSGPGGHVYYGYKNITGANLDLDDTTSYGPETVTLDFDKITPGVYKYYVHWYSGIGTWATSGAMVSVNTKDGEIERFYVPNYTSSSGNWEVFTIDTRNRTISTSSTSARTSMLSLEEERHMCDETCWVAKEQVE